MFTTVKLNSYLPIHSNYSINEYNLKEYSMDFLTHVHSGLLKY